MQSEYYTAYIKRHKSWRLVGIYVDEGSGKNIAHRPSFQKLIQDCEAGNIDLILTKSIKRFGRNTVDVITSCQKIKNLGIEILFELEHISLSQNDSIKTITIFASLAQEESINLSENTKWGLQRSFASGQSRIISRPCYGYRRIKDKLVVNEDEAEIVRRIFGLRSDGEPIEQIAKYLNKRAILTPAKKTKWNSATIFSILRNEKYTGCVLLGKTITKNYYAGTRKRNKGECDRYLIEDSHEPIVDISLFNKVNSQDGQMIKIKSYE